MNPVKITFINLWPSIYKGDFIHPFFYQFVATYKAEFIPGRRVQEHRERCKDRVMTAAAGGGATWGGKGGEFGWSVCAGLEVAASAHKLLGEGGDVLVLLEKKNPEE